MEIVQVRVLRVLRHTKRVDLRHWSHYEYIHNKRRNKLSPARARDLVWVFSNARLQQQLNRSDREEEFLPWAVVEEEEEEQQEGMDDEDAGSGDVESDEEVL